MPEITFAEAIAETARVPRNLLIGNGFSIAQGGQRFAYSTLLEHSGLAPDSEIRNVFRELATVDFEEVMKALEHAAVIEAAYGARERSQLFNQDAATLRDSLIHAVREVHPGIQFDIPDDQRTACAAFIGNFAKIFSLNYDLLLYWVILHRGRHRHSDGFGLGEAVDGFRMFSTDGNCTVYFVHGALHLFLNGQNEAQKRVVTNSTIVDDITDTIRLLHKLPLFVAEGTAAQKMRKINSVPYLRHAYEQLRGLRGSLFIFGHSAGDNDSHIYEAIGKSAITTIYYCVRNPREALARARERFAVFAERHRRIELKYVDAATANVWGPAA